MWSLRQIKVGLKHKHGNSSTSALQLRNLLTALGDKSYRACVFEALCVLHVCVSNCWGSDQQKHKPRGAKLRSSTKRQNVHAFAMHNIKPPTAQQTARLLVCINACPWNTSVNDRAKVKSVQVTQHSGSIHTMLLLFDRSLNGQLAPPHTSEVRGQICTDLPWQPTTTTTAPNRSLAVCKFTILNAHSYIIIRFLWTKTLCAVCGSCRELSTTSSSVLPCCAARLRKIYVNQYH